MLGLYYLPIPTIAHELGWPEQEVLKALRRVSEAPSKGLPDSFCRFDEQNEVVWVVKMAGWQVLKQWEPLSPKDNRCKGIQRDYDILPNNMFLGDFFDFYEPYFHLTTRREPKQNGSPFEAPSKPLRSQEQEQEQEQEQIDRSIRISDLQGQVEKWAGWAHAIRMTKRAEQLAAELGWSVTPSERDKARVEAEDASGSKSSKPNLGFLLSIIARYRRNGGPPETELERKKRRAKQLREEKKRRRAELDAKYAGK